MGSTSGDNSEHGQANARLMRTVVTWMADHAEEIRGIDLNRPMLPQFDLLRDAQVRELFRSADPLANRNN